MAKANQEIRDELLIKHIPYWRIAEVIGVHEMTIVRWLRIPLSKENEVRIRKAISTIDESRVGQISRMA